MLRLLIMISLLIALALSAAPAATTSSPFWSWFSKNEARLADAAKKDPVPVMKEIQDQLERAEKDDDLIVELSLTETPGLVISAGGNASQFGAVKRVVAAAPKLKRWTVIAFRQRRPWMQQIELDGRKLSIDDFSFRVLGQVAGKLDVEICVKGLTDANEKEVEGATFVVLDAVLGEYDTETKIGVIDFTGEKKKAHRPLPELAAAVDKLPRTGPAAE